MSILESQMGFTGSVLHWFSSSLSNQHQIGHMGTSRSQKALITHGVPEDSILSPVIFNLYKKLLSARLTDAIKIQQYVENTQRHSINLNMELLGA